MHIFEELVMYNFPFRKNSHAFSSLLFNIIQGDFSRDGNMCTAMLEDFQVCSSKTSTHVLQTTLYGMGLNQAGQLRESSDSKFFKSPSLMEWGLNVPLSKIVMGRGFSMFLTPAGKISILGNGLSRFGISSGSKCFDFLPTIIDLAAGDSHVLLLTAEGTVYSCGDPTYGQLGRGYHVGTCDLQAIPMSTFDGPIVHVFAGRKASAFLSATGTLYVCGCNVSFNLGVFLDVPFLNASFVPMALTLPVAPASDNASTTATSSSSCSSSNAPARVSQVCMDVCHSLILMEDGRLFACGENLSGQFGLGRTSNTLRSMVPFHVNTLSEKIVRISTGYSFSLALGESGALYVAGYFPPMHVFTRTFTVLSCFDAAEGRKVVDFFADMESFHVVCSDGTCWRNGSMMQTLNKANVVSVVGSEDVVVFVAGMPIPITQEEWACIHAPSSSSAGSDDTLAAEEATFSDSKSDNEEDALTVKSEEATYTCELQRAMRCSRTLSSLSSTLGRQLYCPEFSPEVLALFSAEINGKLRRRSQITDDCVYEFDDGGFLHQLDARTSTECLVLADQLGVRSLKDKCCEVIVHVVLQGIVQHDGAVDAAEVATVEDLGLRYNSPILVQFSKLVRQGRLVRTKRLSFLRKLMFSCS
jgi:alpha-tubulin suppressor-like RCC1 family protein